jgi:hypothetical protein
MGMLVMVLVFGFVFIACSTDSDDDDDTDNNSTGTSINGTWEASNGRVIVFTGNTFEYKVNGATQYSGTFSTSGSTITFTESSLGQASGNFQLSEGTLILSNHTWDSSVNGTYSKSSNSGESAENGDNDENDDNGDNDENGENGDNSLTEPDISVDLALPTIQNVPDFEGIFASSEAAAHGLVVRAHWIIFDAQESLIDDDDYQESVSGNVRNSWLEKIFDQNTTILSEAKVTGFLQKKYATSGGNPTKVGDWAESSMRTKLAIDFNDFVSSYYGTISGKFTLDENGYVKQVVTAINPTNGKGPYSYDATEGYAVSISKNGKGLKFVMKIEEKIPRQTYVSGDDLVNTSYTFVLDIYDNDNVKNEEYSKTFASSEEVKDYFKFSYDDFEDYDD